MNHLPTGTVSFLFTDIEGSTRLAQQHPAELPSLLARHHAILHEAIQAYNGYVFQIIGDAFSAAFHTASDALRAALAAQRGLQHEAWQPTGIKVRMGIHTGMAQAGAIEERAGGYVGYLTLTRTQRVMSAAHGEQVLLSNAAAELIGNDLPAEATMRDMGEHRLKGLDTPDRLWQLLAPDLRQTFPALQSANVIINNLPTQLTPLIGREAELAQLVDLLVPPNPQSPILNPQPPRPAPRLITITGMGGIGKTHFAQVLASRLASAFADGVVYVPLTPVIEHSLVLPTIAQTLTLQDMGGKSVFEALQEHLRAKELLLVLDNFEHVTEAAGQVARLLAHCMRLRILVTSRVTLNVTGEYQHRLAALSQSTSEALLLAHASTSGQVIQASATVTAICKQLDGVPLAIELAAQQLRLLSPHELLNRLNAPLNALTARNPGTRQREHIMRRTLDRSYDMLQPTEQALFRQMGIFVGGCDFCAAFSVFGLSALAKTENRTNLAMLKEQVEFDLFTLLDHSLLRREVQPDGESHYVMHQLVREYAREQMITLGEIAAMTKHHAEYFIGAAELIDAREVHKQKPAKSYLTQVTQEHPELSLLMQTILGDAMLSQGAVANWIKQNLANIRVLADWSHAPRLLRTRGQLYEALGEFESARKDFEQALQVAKSSDDQAAEWQAQLDLGFLWCSRDYAQAGVFFERALAVARNLSDPISLAQTLNRVGNWYLNVEQNAKAITFHNEALEVFEETNDQQGLASTYDLLGMAYLLRGDMQGGYKAYKSTIDYFKESNNHSTLAHIWSLLLVCDGQTNFDVLVCVSLPKPNDGATNALFHLARGQNRTTDIHTHWLLAAYYERIGLFIQASDRYLCAENLAREINHHQWLTAIYGQWGAFFLSLQMPNQAQNYLTQAMKGSSYLGSKYFQTLGSTDMALCAIELNDNKKAAECLYRYSGDDLSAINPHLTQTQRQIWGARASLAIAQGQPQLALDIIERLITHMPNMTPQTVVPALWLRRGKAYAALGAFDQAEADFRAAFDWAQTRGWLTYLWRCELELGKLYLAAQQPDQADQAFERMRQQVLTLAKNVPEHIPNHPNLRQTFVSNALALIPIPHR